MILRSIGSSQELFRIVVRAEGDQTARGLTGIYTVMKLRDSDPFDPGSFQAGKFSLIEPQMHRDPLPLHPPGSISHW